MQDVTSFFVNVESRPYSDKKIYMPFKIGIFYLVFSTLVQGFITLRGVT